MVLLYREHDGERLVLPADRLLGNREEWTPVLGEDGKQLTVPSV
jgi:hypothetical protein